jgi:hypothetical protein
LDPTKETTGESKENNTPAVPTFVATVNLAVTLVAPAGDALAAHWTVDTDVHAVVMQTLESIVTVGVGSFEKPKFRPEIVTLTPLEATVLGFGRNPETAGASKLNILFLVPTIALTVK